MQNYSSAKLELLVLKWAVTKKFKDYLLGSWFTAYTDNNPLAYIKGSKLGVAQIRWFGELALFDFNIKYRTGKSNQAADALSYHPKSSLDMSSDRRSEEEYETISYEVISDDLTELIDWIKIPIELKKEIQRSIHEEPKRESDNIQGTSAMVDVLSKVSPEMMRQSQEEDPEIGKVRHYVMLTRKPSLAQIRKLKSKTVCRYLQQFDWLVFIKGVLHRMYEENGSKYHQLILPIEYWAKAMVMLLYENGDQGVEQTVALVQERFYWGTVLYDVQSWVKNCQHCKTVKGPYTDPEPPQGSIVANNPMDLLLIDFMKLDPSRNGKENVLVMMDAFSKFCVAVVTPNQKAKMVAKALIDKWFYTYGIPACIHSD